MLDAALIERALEKTGKSKGGLARAMGVRAGAVSEILSGIRLIKASEIAPIMPEFDGLDVCREIRKSSDVPILFLSARDEEIDRILGLEIGGDDYVTKPFSPRELVARINVILRRLTPRSTGATADASVLSRGQLSIDPEQHVATFAGTTLRLTAIEFGILRAFLARPVAVFNREQIMPHSRGLIFSKSRIFRTARAVSVATVTIRVVPCAMPEAASKASR